MFHQHVDLALTLAMWERQRESLCENENSMSSFNQKTCVFIKNVGFSLENIGLEPKRMFYITFSSENW